MDSGTGSRATGNVRFVISGDSFVLRNLALVAPYEVAAHSHDIWTGADEFNATFDGAAPRGIRASLEECEASSYERRLRLGTDGGPQAMVQMFEASAQATRRRLDVRPAATGRRRTECEQMIANVTKIASLTGTDYGTVSSAHCADLNVFRNRDHF
jgi:hypothetical protein